jgi:Mn2+/Fe2+ NRAMP family transporter
MVLLLIGKYKIIEKFLIILVIIMGVSFFITGIIVAPSMKEIILGFKPQIPKNSITLILALLGTTIVPYNLFLYSSSVLKKWKGIESIGLMRIDIILAVGLGGFITIAIIITSSVAYYFKGFQISSPVDLSLQLKPVFGKFAEILFGIGLFSAGLSSAITAPYAASFTSKGVFGWKEKDVKFKLVFIFVIITGIIVSFLKIKPLTLIILAQVTNALLLPIVALFIFYLLNLETLKGQKNTLIQNIFFIVIFLIILLINIKKFV